MVHFHPGNWHFSHSCHFLVYCFSLKPLPFTRQHLRPCALGGLRRLDYWEKTNDGRFLRFVLLLLKRTRSRSSEMSPSGGGPCVGKFWFTPCSIRAIDNNPYNRARCHQHPQIIAITLSILHDSTNNPKVQKLLSTQPSLLIDRFLVPCFTHDASSWVTFESSGFMYKRAR